MVKKGFHKVFSLLMAFLVLFSTVSFTIEKHFCGDTLIDVAVFTEAQKCAMDAFEIELATLTKIDCCKDELEIVKGQSILKMTTFEDLHLDHQFFLPDSINFYTNLFEGLPEQIIPHKDYSPPYLIRNIHVMDQVYII